MISVYVTSDDDGHNYVIPHHKKDQFHEMMERAYKEGDFEEFIETFGSYAVDDINSVGLYVKELGS